MTRIPWPLIATTTLLDLLGIVWILQGLGVLGGSTMTGDPFWAGAGMVVLIASGIILAVGIIRARGSGTESP